MQTDYFPQFSIIIPNFNRGKVILTAISSVLDQTYKNFEIIVVDDCSTDNSVQLISEIRDERIKLFKLDENSGAAEARNYGIKMSAGEFISLLDSDDFYEPTFLEKSLNVLGATGDEVGFSWTGVRYLESGKGKEKIWVPEKKETAYLTFLNSLHIGTNSGVTFKREVFQKCGYFNSELPAAEDTDFFLRITKKFNYCIVLEILINIERDGEDRLSKNFQKIAQAYNAFLPDHFSVIDRSKHLQAKFYYKMMWLNFHLNEKGKASFFYKKIPTEFKTIKIKGIKYLYDFLPLKAASLIHKNFSS